MQQLDAGMSTAQLRDALAPSGVTVEGFATDEVYVGFSECKTADCVTGFLRKPNGG
jgi:hypothetical protein